MSLNLFSIFDPTSSNHLSMNWICITFSLMFIPLTFWKLPNRISSVFKIISQTISKELTANLDPKLHTNKLLFLSVFYFILISNLLGLFPYIFTSSSHLMVSLGMSLPSWICLMLYSLSTSFNTLMAHLVPMGAPMGLSMFMVYIETISSLIRPLTLAVRLTANMIAGHLLLSLLSNLSEMAPNLFFASFPAICILLLLEFAVAIIQSYVFFTLLSLYFNEI